MPAIKKIVPVLQLALWRRWALRYPSPALWLCALAWIGAEIAVRAGALTARPTSQQAAGVGAILALLACLWARRERERLVREAALPQFLKRKLREAHPHLSGKDCELVERGFRQFFLACLRSKGQFVAMPSRVVDSMWHEFILHTSAYRQWCQQALGR